MKFAHPLFAFAIVVLLAAVVLTPSSRPSRPMGWNFDTGLAPERLRELLCGEVRAAPPAGSWLRVRDLARSRVFDRRGGEVVLGPAGEARPAVAVRRAALEALRGRGYRLVAVLEGGPFAWRGGVRGTDRERRLPLDLRDAFELGRMLAATYGDLVDWWEIENEPDLGFVVDNPETYAAYLKACYLGIQRGRAELRPPLGAEGLSRVLMAPLALPPGPYFEAWARNGGLGYTDGFNYHYYGYAEDFSGVYRQFQSAVAQWSAAGPPTGTASVFSTQFYPSADGWRAQTIATFEFPPGAAGANLQRIRARPVAREEPVLSAQGRWWVTPGVTVEEAASGTWRFTIAERPPGPALWAPIAELPLPVGWTAPGDAFLSYGYRLAPSGAKATAAPPAPRAEPAPPGFRRALVPTAHLVPAAPAGSPPRPVASALWPSRELPVFLTEYGYGSLSRSARLTAEGRERQRRWFESVGAQIRALGIEGAMAFLLRPYLEVERLEYGLMMNADSGPPPGPGGSEGSALPGARWGAETVSPALADLLRQGRKPLRPRPWTVATPPVQEVVIDFIAGQGLGQAKAYAGYFLEGVHGRSEPGQGSLVVYNLGETPVTGLLALEGAAWRLPDGSRTVALSLAPGERQLVAVHVATGLSQFLASPVSARFDRGPVPPPVAPVARPAPAARSTPVATVKPPPPPPPAPDPETGESFDTYLRMENGNLYHARSGVRVTPTWRSALDRIDNFAPAFYGRHELPWRLSENRPAALVFFFRPTTYPAVFEITSPEIKRFAAPPPAK